MKVKAKKIKSYIVVTRMPSGQIQIFKFKSAKVAAEFAADWEHTPGCSAFVGWQ